VRLAFTEREDSEGPLLATSWGFRSLRLLELPLNALMSREAKTSDATGSLSSTEG